MTTDKLVALYKVFATDRLNSAYSDQYLDYCLNQMTGILELLAKRTGKSVREVKREYDL